MKNPLIYLFITLYALTACSNGEDYREPKSEEDLSGLVLAASNGSYYQQKYEKRADVQLFLTSSEADGVQAVRQGHADVLCEGMRWLCSVRGRISVCLYKKN